MRTATLILGMTGVLALVAGLAPGTASAGTVINLELQAGGVITSSGGVGVEFTRADTQPAGTGVIDSFLRIRRIGAERGYNTSARPTTYDELTDGNFTRPLMLGDIPVVVREGTRYRQFILDINEPLGGGRALVSLNDVRIAHGAGGGLSGLWGNGLAGTTTLWAMNDGNVDHLHATSYQVLTDRNRVDLKSFNSGSGQADMFMYVPDSVFTGLGVDDFIYLYSRFGSPNPTEGGFEEWAAGRPLVREGGPREPPAYIPSPTAALGGLALLGFTALTRRGRAAD